MNIYVVYEINLRSCTVGQDTMLGNSLFLAIKLTANADPDKYKYSGCGIGLDASGSFSFSDGSEFGKNVIINIIMF